MCLGGFVVWVCFVCLFCFVFFIVFFCMFKVFVCYWCLIVCFFIKYLVLFLNLKLLLLRRKLDCLLYINELIRCDVDRWVFCNGNWVWIMIMYDWNESIIFVWSKYESLNYYLKYIKCVIFNVDFLWGELKLISSFV